MKVTVVDYGTSNLNSVCRGLKECGGDVKLADDTKQIANAELLVLPGVGAFGDCAHRLAKNRLDEAIKGFIESEKPFLGICVGMQLLFDLSDEYGPREGLSILSGTVTKIPRGEEPDVRRVPHIGWQTLSAPSTEDNWKGTILNGIGSEESVYFVHSYTAWPEDESDRLADAYHDGSRIAAVVRRGPVTGCQFHPEKSGPVGLRILSNFIEFA